MEKLNSYSVIYTGSYRDKSDKDKKYMFIGIDSYSGGYAYLTSSIHSAETFCSYKEALRFAKRQATSLYNIPENERNKNYFKIIQLGFEILG